LGGADASGLPTCRKPSIGVSVRVEVAVRVRNRVRTRIRFRFMLGLRLRLNVGVLLRRMHTNCPPIKTHPCTASPNTPKNHIQ